MGTGAGSVAGVSGVALRDALASPDGLWRVDLPVGLREMERADLHAEFGAGLFLMDVTAATGAVALLLALGSVVAVTLERVKANRRELGIRAALGASPGALVSLVLGQTLVRVGAGLVLGVPGVVVYNALHPSVGSSAVAMLTSPVLWGVLGLTVAATLVASVAAARAAAKADPSELPRAE